MGRTQIVLDGLNRTSVIELRSVESMIICRVKNRRPVGFYTREQFGSVVLTSRIAALYRECLQTIPALDTRPTQWMSSKIS